MIGLTVRAIGLVAPGLTGWDASRPILAGAAAYHLAELLPPKPAMLPASERRRATAVTRLALAAAEDALAGTGQVPAELATVFASSSGDMEIFDRICRVLQEADRPVSPTHFHNSVHNAAAGYWAIASHSRCGSLSLSAYDGSFAVGLLETACLVAAGEPQVLFVAYDAPAPAPLATKRPITTAFAAALLCAPASEDTCLAHLHIGPGRGTECGLADAALEHLRLSNPAARALPLLQAIARGHAGTITLPAGSGLVAVEVSR